jgi:broad specificity phosphatase PhoE
MRSLILIRHAQSEHHVKDLIGGWADFDLTAFGRHQARCLASRLEAEVGDTSCLLVCSDLQRAVQTAEIVGQALGALPNPTPELREHGCGIVEGMPVAEARRHYIEPTEPLCDWAIYPGAETWRRVYDRIVPCVERLIEEERDLVVLVSHKVPIHLTVCWWLGLGLDHQPSVWFDTQPASITALRIEPWGGHTVERLNDTAHLCAVGLEGA